MDHALVDKLNKIENYETLNRVEYSSDYRACRITVNVKINNKMINRKFQNVNKYIPVWKYEEANDLLRKELSKKNDSIVEIIQELYEKMENALKKVKNILGHSHKKRTTDSKLSINTKNLIKRREELKHKNNKSNRELIELTEIKKLIKKEIKNDIHDFDYEIIKNTVEE